LKARIYCKRCNDTFGAELDNEVAKCFGHFATILSVKRERGSNQPFEVQEVKAGTKLLWDGKSMSRKDPVVKLEIDKDGRTLKSVDITARSESELNKIITSLEKKYQTQAKPRVFPEYHPGPTETKFDFVLDTSILRRSVAKIAYSFLAHKLSERSVLSRAFDEVRSYIVHGAGGDLSSPNFAHTTFMTDYIRPLHKIYIRLDRMRHLVVGYVMFFGTFRYSILLSRDFVSPSEWPCLDHTIDPVTSKIVEGNANFRAPSISENQILRPRHPRQLVLHEIYKGHKILESYVPGYDILRIEKEN